MSTGKKKSLQCLLLLFLKCKKKKFHPNSYKQPLPQHKQISLAAAIVSARSSFFFQFFFCGFREQLRVVAFCFCYNLNLSHAYHLFNHKGSWWLIESVENWDQLKLPSVGGWQVGWTSEFRSEWFGFGAELTDTTKHNAQHNTTTGKLSR